MGAPAGGAEGGHADEHGCQCESGRKDGAQRGAGDRGMTCAWCAARIEKKLNKLEGVTATVNFATEKAQAGAWLPAGPPNLPDWGSAVSSSVARASLFCVPPG